MNKEIKIYIFGASGSGVTTLGKKLSEYYQIPFLDADDYFWKETNPPFQEANSIETRKILLNKALSPHSSWVIAGSILSWADEVQDDFSFAVYLYVPQDERVQRIKNREQKRFGKRIDFGGDMYEGHEKFIEWTKQYDAGTVSGRSKPRHEAWMKILKCPIMKIEGVLSEADVLSKAISQINQLKNPIIIEKYNSLWSDVFEQLKQTIWPCIKDSAISMEHVGSTSVPGLFAKPVIDIDIVVSSSEHLQQCIHSLEKLGYIHRGDLGVKGREAFKRPPDSPIHNLYACLKTSVALKNHILLRDFLRKNDMVRNQYSDLKMRLSKEFAYDIDGYCEAKTPFIISILEKCGLSDNELKEISSANIKMENTMTTFKTSIEIPASIEQVFAAISTPERLANWWGPAGFTNTFSVCEFKTGGKWSLVMHSPTGQDYPNENVFTEIEPLKKVVVKHIGEPKFSLAITLDKSAKGTLVSWAQSFESSEVAKQIEHIVVPANDQNLERLSVEVLKNGSK